MLRSKYRFLILPLLAFLVVGCTACGSTKSRPIQRPAIAPGTISLQATLGTCSARERWTDCNSIVVKVLEYGSGTPQLPNGTQIRVSILNTRLEDLRTASPTLITDGNEVEMVIAYARSTDPANTFPEWKIVSIK